MLHFFGPKGKHLQLLVRMECWRDSEDRGPFRPNYGVVIAIWRRKWQSTPIFLPGKFHGWRSLVGYSPWGCKESDTAERLHFHFNMLGQFHDKQFSFSISINKLQKQVIINIAKEQISGFGVSSQPKIMDSHNKPIHLGSVLSNEHRQQDYRLKMHASL